MVTPSVVLSMATRLARTSNSTNGPALSLTVSSVCAHALARMPERTANTFMMVRINRTFPLTTAFLINRHRVHSDGMLLEHARQL
jgi:hypothetical protein